MILPVWLGFQVRSVQDPTVPLAAKEETILHEYTDQLIDHEMSLNFFRIFSFIQQFVNLLFFFIFFLNSLFKINAKFYLSK